MLAVDLQQRNARIVVQTMEATRGNEPPSRQAAPSVGRAASLPPARCPPDEEEATASAFDRAPSPSPPPQQDCERRGQR